MAKIISKDHKRHLIISVFLLVVLTSCTVKITPLQSGVSAADWEQFKQKPLGVFVIVPEKQIEVVRTYISPSGGIAYYHQYRHLIPYSHEWGLENILINNIVSMLMEKYGLPAVLLENTNPEVLAEITDNAEAIHNKLFKETFAKYLQSDLHKDRQTDRLTDYQSRLLDDQKQNYAVMKRTPRELHNYFDELSEPVDAQYRSLLNRIDGVDYVMEVAIAALAIHLDFREIKQGLIFRTGNLYDFASYLNGKFYVRIIKISDGSVIWWRWRRVDTEQEKRIFENPFTAEATISKEEYEKHGWQPYLDQAVKEIDKLYYYVMRLLTDLKRAGEPIL